MILPAMLAAANPIVHVNAGLNTLATLLLILGLVFIKQRKENAHRIAMGSAFLVSTLFLVCYLYYHYTAGSVKFTAEGPVRYVYLTILATHVVLAMTVPFFAIAAIYYGWRAMQGDGSNPEARAKHRKIVRWGYPIWLYVSVTGVVVYAMLYHLWPSAEI